MSSRSWRSTQLNNELLASRHHLLLKDSRPIETIQILHYITASYTTPSEGILCVSSVPLVADTPRDTFRWRVRGWPSCQRIWHQRGGVGGFQGVILSPLFLLQSNIRERRNSNFRGTPLVTEESRVTRCSEISVSGPPKNDGCNSYCYSKSSNIATSVDGRKFPVAKCFYCVLSLKNNRMNQINIIFVVHAPVYETEAMVHAPIVSQKFSFLASKIRFYIKMGTLEPKTIF